MASPYKRRKPSLIRNMWIYRHLIAVAFVLGVVLWFVFINNTKVEVVFPFGMGMLNSSTGVIMLLSAMGGSLLTLLVLGVLYTLRRLKAGAAAVDEEKEADPMADDLPPSDYASKAPEGLGEAPWGRLD